MRTVRWTSLVWLVGILSASLGWSGEARLLRFPDIHRDRVAFVYAGDIWLAPSTGGEALRLTSHEGQELFPKFSPDGRQIAFSAEYSGSRQVYVIDVEGGQPRQLTYYNDVGAMPPRGGFDYRVLDWNVEGTHVLVRANRLPWGVRMGRPYLVPAAGGMEKPLAVPESGAGMFSPDGKKLVYTPIDREFRTWKRYQGGRAQDVWIYDLEKNSAEQITTFKGTDNQPTWVGNTIYFTSDRDWTLNLFAYDLESKQVRKITQSRDYDVLWPSAGPQQVVYESGGYLYRYDTRDDSVSRISVTIGGDRPHAMPRIENVEDKIESFDLSPRGKRAIFAARGEIWTVPAKDGVIRNVSRTAGIREMSPVWSPDGRFMAYYSDATGEYEIYLRSADEAGEPRKVSSGGSIWRFPLVWSPDSRKLAFGDKNQRLQYIDVESGKITSADHSTSNDIRVYRWSPDSRWLVYTKVEASSFSSIYVYSLESKKVTRLTDEFTNDYDPVFDPEGRYLYFFSDRDYNLAFSGYEFNYLYKEPTRVYAATLTKDGPALFAPKSDEVEPVAEDAAASDSAGKEGSRANGDEEDSVEESFRIDFEGFADRIVALPGRSGIYHQLSANDSGALYISGRAGEAKLEHFNVTTEKTETIIEGISSYKISANGKKLIFSSRGTYGIIPIQPGQSADKGKLDLSEMRMKIDPQVEWKQLYADAWRIFRDWFYDPGMHGMDWEKIRARYEPMVEHVVYRADLDYILGELGGELNAGHVYINGSPGSQRVKRVDGGLLGAEIDDHPSGYFQIRKIFRGENWHEEFRSPLTEVGVDVNEGDFLLAVNGRSTRNVRNFYELLEDSAGDVVTLSVNDRPGAEGAREVKVRPIARETNLRYLDWVESRRDLVNRLSGGRIGYIHLPNTAIAGNRELRKNFFPQSHKDALIIDVRYNGGGFIPDRMIEIVQRTLLHYWVRRGLEPQSVPGYVHSGPKACLINAYSSSGGDAFPYYFRKLGLGPLIGKRTWGGLIGISGNPALMDGATLAVPRFRFLDVDGKWAVENEGVSPDIEVLDRPDLVARGQDPTLEAAIKHLLSKLEEQAPAKVTVPDFPKDFDID